MSQVNFSDLKLAQPIKEALNSIGYNKPTPIQEQTIPLTLQGHDILGIAQTGTGKTAAFCLPIINHLYVKKIDYTNRCPRTLILTPTRELAIQIHQNLESYGQNTLQKYAVIFGGVNQNKQVREMKAGVDVLVATPGRLIDLIQQKFISLNKVEMFVLDEADRMLDMGFMEAIQKILPLLPKKRHNLFFSATMPNKIQKLANEILFQPKKIEVTPAATTVKKIAQSVMYVDKPNKINLLVHLLKNNPKQKTLVFLEMKYAANRVGEKLEKSGIRNVVIHGNKSQSARQKAIQAFTKNEVNIMLATDIASRGIDIDDITHVINFELSNIAESYVHRIGRTARAGKEGVAISLVTADEKSFLVNIEKTTNQTIPINTEHPFHSQNAQDATISKVGKAKAKIERERKKELNASFRKKAGDKNRIKSNKKSGKKTTSKKSFSKSKENQDGDSAVKPPRRKKKFFNKFSSKRK